MRLFMDRLMFIMYKRITLWLIFVIILFTIPSHLLLIMLLCFYVKIIQKLINIQIINLNKTINQTILINMQLILKYINKIKLQKGQQKIKYLLLFYSMLDYYFCEECQTYHQPNRFINGEILSACECSISTQSGTSSRTDLNYTDTFTKNRNKKLIQKQIVRQQINPTPILYIQSPSLSPSLSPRTNPQSSQIFSSRHSGIQHNNLPFLSIVSQQNKQNMKRIIIERSPLRPPNVQIISPSKINRQQIFIKQPVIPISRPIQQIIKKQQIKPTKIQIKTPIQTLQNLGNLPKSARGHKISISPRNHEIKDNSQTKNSNINLQQNQFNTNKITLDRVSGQTFHMDYTQYQINDRKTQRVELDRVIEDRKYVGISLDRVTQQKNVIAETDQKDELCGKLCYY